MSRISRRMFLAASTTAAATLRSTMSASAATPTSSGTKSVPRTDPGSAVQPATPADTTSGFVQQVSSRVALPASVAVVTSLAVRSGTVAAGHAGGLSVGTAGSWSSVLTNPVYAVAALADGRFAALIDDALAMVTQQSDQTWTATLVPLPHGAVGSTTLLAAAQGTPVVATGRSLWDLVGNQNWRRRQLPGNVTALAISGSGQLAISVGGSVYESALSHTGWAAVALANAKEGWAPPAVSYLAYDSAGRLWFASVTQGVGYRDPDAGWVFIDPRRGLPSLDITGMLPGVAEDMWLPTSIAAMRYDGVEWEYREGRWLPANTVTAAATDIDGTAYFATPAGFGLISFEQTTMLAKALRYEPIMDARHKRTPYEYVVPASLATAGDVSTFSTPATDNDGLSTAMYGAAQCFRYAVTNDPDARDKAKKAFLALKFMGDVTQGGTHPAPPGFVCRAITSTDGSDPNLVDSVANDKKERQSDALWKILPVRWPTSADGKWYWKADTSADELDGHFTFYALYHDLVATSGSDREDVVAVVKRLADHLIDHNYNLVDYDGKPTRWGFFGPDQLNLNPWREDERGLNSISIVTYMTIADHVVGGSRYRNAKDSLAYDHGYQLNSLFPQFSLGIGGNNTSDENLAFLLYYALLGYEKDATLKHTWALSLWLYWNTVQYESHPRFTFTSGQRLAGAEWVDAYGPVALDLADGWQDPGLDSLRRFPLDLVVWNQTNSPRLDLTPFPEWLYELNGSGGGTRSDGRLLPVDERPLSEFNGGVYPFDGGSGGFSEEPATPYLLAYWMGRYHGIIDADA